ncbi:MAG: hypothetical protein LBQ90_01735 [Synergistaceae bacterium]|jgi:hypothetical protein|nr:hypothetical protein [Synergistaceae bacterium]
MKKSVYMKRALAVVAIVAVLCVSGVAFAGRDGPRAKEWGHCDRGEGFRRGGPAWHDGERGGRGWRHRGWMDRDDWSRRDVPDEIRSKMSELEKFRIDMRDALTRNPIDRARATEAFEKIQTLRRELAGWFFNRRLDNLEERQKQQK